MPELLFEIGTEEIPAEDLGILPWEFKRIATALFDENRLTHQDLQSFATPRRLVLTGILALRQQDLRQRKLGPPRKVAVDENGNPTPAGLGFARNSGTAFERLNVVETERGEYLAADIVVRGKSTAEVLKAVLPDVVKKLPFRKYMQWEQEGYLFGRPIRRIVLLFNGRIIPITIAGIRAGRNTFGHRFLGQKKINVKSFEDYSEKLANNGVVLRFVDRIEKIKKELNEQVLPAPGNLKTDDELLHVMANEVEFPEVLRGGFASDFLRLPQEILINTMRKHQKYFSALDSNGNLLPVFFTVLNTRAAKPELIRRGHERVLHARLRDAEFFWNEDRKHTLESRVPALERLMYHVKLGSYAAKVERMMEIADIVLPQLQRQDLAPTLRRLIQLSKADLVTLMVGEFPELQGNMGGLYAREEGFPQQEWQALYDQYLPVSAEDTTPRNLYGALLSLIDRIESLASGFALSMIPTGSKDPYALRRIATGAIRIILEFSLEPDMRAVFTHALSLYDIKLKQSPKELVDALMELLQARFRFLMEQRSIRHDYLNAVLAVEKDSFLSAYAKVNALWAKRESDDLKILARAFKRINNIIQNQTHQPFDIELLREDGETRLHRAFTDLEFRVRQNIHEKEFADALDIMVTLGPEIDNFFDEVLVMAEDLKLRNNRIALLQRISELYHRIADFSALQLEL